MAKKIATLLAVCVLSMGLTATPASASEHSLETETMDTGRCMLYLENLGRYVIGTKVRQACRLSATNPGQCVSNLQAIGVQRAHARRACGLL